VAAKRSTLPWTFGAIITLLSVYLGTACWLGLPPCAPHTSYRHATECRDACARDLQGVTEIRVWSAGHHTPPDQFCAPCSGPRPTKLYETSAPDEIRALTSALSFSWTFDEPRVRMCGPITVDFLRDKEIVLSLNFHTDYVESTWRSGWSAPLSRRGRLAVNEWMTGRGLIEKAVRARSTP
jgi:hypothetical protein